MVDNKTQHLGLPLPDLSNMQDEDVPRIGQALRLIDAHVQGVDAGLQAQGSEVQALKEGNVAQTEHLDQLVQAQEKEAADRAAADSVAASRIDALSAGQVVFALRVDTAEHNITQHGTSLEEMAIQNTQQDTRLTSAETALAGKANTDLGNVNTANVKLLLNEVVYETGSWASSSATIPMDDTIPQITEGTQVMAASIVPKKANSKITVKVKMFISGNGSNHSMAAIFKDSEPNAIESCLVTTSGSNYGLPIVMEKTLSLGDTSPHTFSVRIGSYSGTMYMNGNSSGRLFGGTFLSSITIEEHTA